MFNSKVMSCENQTKEGKKEGRKERRKERRKEGKKDFVMTFTH